MKDSDPLMRLKAAMERDTADEIASKVDRRWLIAWIVFYTYLITALFIGYWINRGDLDAPMSRKLFLFFVPVFVFLAVAAQMKGEAYTHFTTLKRSTEPVSFWSLVIFYWLAGFAFLVIGGGAMLGWWL